MNYQKGMPLSRALRVRRGDVVSFVGGGGKTSSMFRLASELSSAGFRVVTTTTTHISEEQTRMAPTSLGLDQIDLLDARLDAFGHCLLKGLPDGKGRVFGASPELIRALHIRSGIDVVLVEADGSRSRPFKAPGAHEPVVPDSTTILVPIAGLNVVGLELDEKNAHRSEIIASLAAQPLGTPVTAETIARVLAHPAGGAKQLPGGARLVPVLNRADADADLEKGREIAERLTANPTVDSIIISSMVEAIPVRECRARVAGIILAAGMSSRFGSTKQTFPWERTNLVAHCTRIALDAGLEPVVVVLGCEAANVETAVAGLPVQCVFNREFAAGQSTSIRCGVDALPGKTGAALFLLADQPLVTPLILKEIVRAHRETFAPACVPEFEGKRGNPALFDRDLFDELRGLTGDTGGRELLLKYSESIVSVPSSRAVVLDIDTPEDCELLKNEYNAAHNPQEQ